MADYWGARPGRLLRVPSFYFISPRPPRVIGIHELHTRIHLLPCDLCRYKGKHFSFVHAFHAFYLV